MVGSFSIWFVLDFNSEVLKQFDYPLHEPMPVPRVGDAVHVEHEDYNVHGVKWNYYSNVVIVYIRTPEARQSDG